MAFYQVSFPHIVGAEASSVSSYGQGTGRTWLTNVQCIGNEIELGNCTANSSGISSCTHAQDVGVRCRQGI